MLNPSDLRYGHEPGGMARKEAWKWKRRRWLLAALVVVLVCGGALGYVFGVSSDNKKRRSSSVEAPSSAPSSSAPAPEPSPSPTPSPSVKPGNPTARSLLLHQSVAVTVAHTITTPTHPRNGQRRHCNPHLRIPPPQRRAGPTSPSTTLGGADGHCRRRRAGSSRHPRRVGWPRTSTPVIYKRVAP